MNEHSTLAVVVQRYTKPQPSWGFHILTPNENYDPNARLDDSLSLWQQAQKRYPYQNLAVGLFADEQEALNKMRSHSAQGCNFDQKFPYSQIDEESYPGLGDYIRDQVVPIGWKSGFNPETPNHELQRLVFIWTQHRYASLVLDEV